MSNGASARSRGGKGVQIEVLLKGAEKLCAVYAVPGAMDKIAYLRHKHSLTSQSIAEYEVKVSQQQTRLARLNRTSELGQDEFPGNSSAHGDVETVFTEDDLQIQREEVLELERKKKDLEDRVAGMERDLGGLLR